MNTTTITIELTPEERIDLLLLRDRLLDWSRDRVPIMAPSGNGSGDVCKGIALTDAARDAERILTILERILFVKSKPTEITP